MRLFISLIFLLSLAACQKKQCWECTVNTENQDHTPRDTVVFPECDKTKSEIRDYENTLKDDPISLNKFFNGKVTSASCQ